LITSILRRRTRRPVALFTVAAVTGALSTLATGAAFGAATTHAQSSPTSHPTERLCSAPKRPGMMACFAVRRLDSLHQKVGPKLPSGYGPADIQEAYGLAGADADGRTVAIVDAYDDPTAESDLATYRSTYGLPACTTANGCFTKVNQNGQQGNYPAGDPGWAGEISLDLDMVSAACPSCDILLVEASTPSMANLGTAVNTAVAMGAKYVSNSYGASESSGETSWDSSYFHHPGVAITVSTGDSGYGVQYPAASPYVTAVGGTSLTRSGNPRGWTEAAWGGAGSGCSAYEAKPSWQNTVSTGCSRRAVADVSAVADPNTGVAVYQSYGGSGWAVYGGTSASSPIVAGVYALAGVPGAGDTPASYAYAHAGYLWDVTTGSNGSCSPTQLCHAVPGWDGPTGLGTANTSAAFPEGLLVSNGPCVAVAPDGSQYVFWKGLQNDLYTTYYDGNWHPVQKIGMGPLGSSPTCGVDQQHRQYVFWRGPAGALKEAYYNLSTWSGHTIPVGTIPNAPTTAVTPGGGQFVFWKGSDGDLYETSYSGSWSSPVDLGMGPLGSNPSAGASSTGKLFVFWRGPNGKLREGFYNLVKWIVRSVPIGTITNPPSVAVSPDGKQYVFWKGADASLHEAFYDGGWSGNLNLGMGPLGSNPSAGADTAHHQYVFWQGTDRNLDEGFYNASWHGPIHL
jgi:hypothetical protein